MAQRDAIRVATESWGASLICLKKAKQFSLWAERVARPPFMLVADWREAKPCIKVICGTECCNKPFLTVIVCTSLQQHSRASLWAQSLPASAGPISICEASLELQATVPTFVQQFFTRPPAQVSAVQHDGGISVRAKALAAPAADDDNDTDVNSEAELTFSQPSSRHSEHSGHGDRTMCEEQEAMESDVIYGHHAHRSPGPPLPSAIPLPAGMLKLRSPGVEPFGFLREPLAGSNDSSENPRSPMVLHL